MTNTTTRRAERQRAHRNHWILGIGTLTAVALLTVFALTRSGSSSGTGAERTDETNSMGMPIIATPGAGSGVAEADGVTATPGLWALGRVPLDVAVRPNWQLQNTGTQAFTLGTPHVQINEGCCPGALTYGGATTLQPDQSTDLTFELSMHPGMDGAHDMTIHVPVQYSDGSSSVLDLAVTGDFRN
ncbi:MAG: hypothetical protein Q7V62_14055 [Actinomycetota bacterium]|nr:hypothetical protein [Actinomycetota bacterium]